MLAGLLSNGSILLLWLVQQVLDCLIWPHPGACYPVYLHSRWPAAGTGPWLHAYLFLASLRWWKLFYTGQS